MVEKSLKNMLLKISDTAGIRFSKNQVESKGIERTWSRVERADVVLWVIDVSKIIDEQDWEIFERFYLIVYEFDLNPLI